MLFKLLLLTILVGMAMSCCLPNAFQVTVLTESSSRFAGTQRSRVIMAANFSEGRATVMTFTEQGYNNMIYANLRTGRAHINNPPNGCYDVPIDASFAAQLNQSRCLPPQLAGNSSIGIRIAGGVNARLYSLNIHNASVNALISDSCEPIIVKVTSPDSDSTSLFGDFYAQPQPGMLDLPPACQNATRIGRSGPGKKRDSVSVNFSLTPNFV